MHWTAAQAARDGKRIPGGRIHFPPSFWQGRVYVGSGDGWVYCFEASSGRKLWRFRAAPRERKIPVYGSISSTWPVASGVLVENGTAYAAAGITGYDGTYVYALDAATGKKKWSNDSSKQFGDQEVMSGVSVQGHLLLHDDKLYLAGGSLVSPAVYDINDGKCLNTIKDQWQRAPRGRELFLVDNEVKVFDQLLYTPRDYLYVRANYGSYESKYRLMLFRVSSGSITIGEAKGSGGMKIIRLANPAGMKKDQKNLWETEIYRIHMGLVLAGNAVLVLGEHRVQKDEFPLFGLTALNLDNGKTLWSHTLPAAPQPWGMAVDRAGRIIVSLRDGSVFCFGRKN